jgi:hypothetical protein
LKREGLPHQIHTNEDDNFKITSSGAQGLLTNTLSRVEHLRHILSILVVDHKFYIHNTYAVRDVVLKSLRKPFSLMNVSNWDRRGTPIKPQFLGIFGRGRRETSTIRFSPFHTRE